MLRDKIASIWDVTCQGWWGCVFCSLIGLSHLFLSSVLCMPLSSFCHVRLICCVIIFHSHVTVATPISYYLFHFCLSVFRTIPSHFFFICHLIVILLPLPTWPVFMLPNLCSFILLFLLMFIPFSLCSCILATTVGFPCFSVPWSCCWDSQSMKVFPFLCIHTLLFTDGILEAQK